MFERLVYVSKARHDISARDAYDIVRVAHNRNSAAGLTGGLLLVDGHFIQVLEGQSEQLDERFKVIAQDRRHTDVEIRWRAACESPMFPGEWMALRNGIEIDEATRQKFNYKPGLPASEFSGPRITAFVLACCSAYRHAAERDGHDD
jgi:hypothetical protein